MLSDSLWQDGGPVLARVARPRHRILFLDGKGGRAEGVALAVAQLPLLCAPRQNRVNVLQDDKVLVSPGASLAGGVHAHSTPSCPPHICGDMTESLQLPKICNNQILWRSRHELHEADVSHALLEESSMHCICR